MAKTHVHNMGSCADLISVLYRLGVVSAIASICFFGASCSTTTTTAETTAPTTLRMTLGRNTVFFHTQKIRVSVLDAEVSGNVEATCDQIKDRVYGVDQNNIDVLEQVDRAWDGAQPDEIVFNDVDVPFDKPILIVVEGLAKIEGTGVIHIVGRGCVDATFVESPTARTAGDRDPLQGITVQLSATAGLGCSSSATRCEPNLQCTGGLCLKDSCSAQDPCPPATYCIQGSCRKSCSSSQADGQGSGECSASNGVCQLAPAANGNCEAACIPGSAPAGC